MWYTGKIEPIWDELYKNLPFEKIPPNEKDLEYWTSKGYDHKSFTGRMYNSKNPMPDWCYQVAENLGLKNCGFVIYQMKTNDIMPTHVDHFEKYCEIFNVNLDQVWRAAVFLEDWKPGHYFEIEHQAFCNYKKGSYVIWSHDAPHAAANIGLEDRYTLQITGTFV